MNDCLFCKIASGEIPATKIYEDENTFAFLDINPTNIGDTLVIPKKHSKNIFDIEKEDLDNVMNSVQKISKAIKKGLDIEGINIINNNEPVAGQIIFHTHFHIVPRVGSDGFKHWQGKRKYEENEAELVAEKIKDSL